MGIIGSKENYEMDYKVINNIKALGIDMIHEANSGHPGIVLGAAPIIYMLYAKHLVFDTINDKWVNRDRFVMSGGHGSALLYATLLMSGFSIKLNDLKNFRKLGSITPGHPEYNLTPGVDMSTGPLGQGFASAVGMAIAEKFLNNRYLYNKSKKRSLIDHYTYVLCGDGDLMEGVSYEAASIAGNLDLNKLIVLYDSNKITLDTDTTNTFKENVLKRFEAMNWNTIEVDSDNLRALDEAISKAKESTKPTLIKVNTIIGKDSLLEGTSSVHGKPLTDEDIAQLKQKLDIRDVAFTVTQDAYSYMQEQIKVRNVPIIERWKKESEKVLKASDEVYQMEFDKLVDNDLSLDSNNLSLSIEELKDEPLRDTSSKILNDFVNENILMMGGSADLASSTKTYLKNMEDFTSENLKGRNIRFGVREHAMGAIANGITLSGIRFFCSTFLSFSDYLKPAIRMSALMNLPVIYIFTHDNITVGEDGPTHEPVEQLVGLRSIPNLEVYRPSDVNELLGVYKIVLAKREGPSVIVVSKEMSKILDCTKANEVKRGGYIVKDVIDKPINGIIISCGNELGTVLNVSKALETKGIYTRVVSVPCISRFIKQRKDYYDNILLPSVKKFVVEYSSSYSWTNFVDDPKCLICFDQFGESGNKLDILRKYKLDEESITKRIEDLLK